MVSKYSSRIVSTSEHNEIHPFIDNFQAGLTTQEDFCDEIQRICGNHLDDHITDVNLDLLVRFKY